MSEPVSRARVVEVGEKIVAYMRANPRCFQEQAAIAGGLSPDQYHRWMSREGEVYELFRCIVWPAVMEQAEAAEERAEKDIGSCENGSSAWANWHKWKLAQRYRKIFGDLAQKIEVSGPNGGAVQVDAVAKMSLAELKAEAKRLMSEEEDAGE